MTCNKKKNLFIFIKITRNKRLTTVLIFDGNGYFLIKFGITCFTRTVALFLRIKFMLNECCFKNQKLKLLCLIGTWNIYTKRHGIFWLI